MPENEKQDSPPEGGGMPDAAGVQHDGAAEYRSLTTAIAAVTIPAATVLKPVATEWAKQHFSQKADAAPPPQQEQKTD
jgi:hypothetical protein